MSSAARRHTSRLGACHPRTISTLAVMTAWAIAAGCGGGDEPVPSQAAALAASTADSTPKPHVKRAADVPPAGSVESPTVTAAEAAPAVEAGQRFTLRKIVEQTLVQQTPDGPTHGRTRLESLIDATFDQVRPDGHKRLALRFRRVRYWHEMDGRRFLYDSAAGGPPPPQVRHSALAVGDGFAVWIGPDQRIVEAPGFDEFLARCCSGARETDRSVATADRGGRSRMSEHLLEFLDDSFGLLPPDQSGGLESGMNWLHQRRLPGTMPLHLEVRCTMGSLTDTTAAIDLAGHIAALPAGPADGVLPVAAEVRVTLRGGRISGRSTIDRRTGLPIRSHIERRLDMLVESPGSPAFTQTKQVVTTVETLPQG